MSIITEALKKVEKERKESQSSEAIAVSSAVDEGAGNISGGIDWHGRRQLAAFGLLIIVAIVFLSAANVFIISSADTDAPLPSQFTIAGDNQIGAETYAMAIHSNAEALEQNYSIFKKFGKVMKRAAPKDEFASNFELNGIIYDADNSWAIINNKMVKIGDIISGAKIVSISPQKAALLVNEKIYELSVK